MGDPLPAYSLAEAFLYLMVTPCSQCGRGPLRGEDARSVAGGEPVQLTIPVRCGQCGHQQDVSFSVPDDIAQLRSQQREGALVRVNPTRRPSRIVDVAQWITLFRVITEAAAKEIDKVEARRLGYEAAQCLEEALKFYDDDNELPPDTAFFHEVSRAVRRKHPHEFSRERLIGLRARLPTLDAMEACQLGKRRRKRKWWTPWRR